jgi:hypothetical protein
VGITTCTFVATAIAIVPIGSWIVLSVKGEAAIVTVSVRILRRGRSRKST